MNRRALTKILSPFLIAVMAFSLISPMDRFAWMNFGSSDSGANNSNTAYGLVAASPLGGTNSTEVLLKFEKNVLDSGPSHNNGQVVGTAQYVAGVGRSYAFGFNDASHVTISNPSSFAFDRTNPFTISFSVKMPPNSSNDMYLVSNSLNENSGGISIWKSHLSNSLTFKIENTYTKVFEVTTNFTNFNVSDNAWHLFLFSYDGSGNQMGMSIYADGALQATGAASTISGTFATNNPMTVGSTVSGTLPFVGTMDNLQILNHLYTASAMGKFFDQPRIHKPMLYTPVVTKSGVSLSWLPIVGAVGYNIYRDGVKITAALEPSPSYFDGGLAPNTQYNYNVVAVNSTGASSPASKIMYATTSSGSLSTPLRAVIFSPSVNSATLKVLKASFKAGDGLVATRIPYIEQFQDSLKIPGMKHFLLAPRITALAPGCNLGFVPSFDQFVAQSKVAKAKGYDIDAIIYDIEGWCWTPQIEQTNYASYIDQAAQLAHDGGFKSGVVPTHSELMQWYTNIHWKNVDYLFIQFQKQMMTKNSGYTLEDPQYYQDVQTVISFVKAQNPSISIIVNYSVDWEPTGSMIDELNTVKSEVTGVNMYDLPPWDPNNLGSPYPGYNTPANQSQFLLATKGM